MRLKRPLEKVFLFVSPLLRPVSVQRFLRRLGIPLPYFLARHLHYHGIVSFQLRGTTLLMQSHNTPIEVTIFWKGLFKGREGAELKFWDSVAQKADVILDIGANSGVYSLVASLARGVRVYAFEPVPVVFRMLQENIRLNEQNNIIAKEMVVGEREGKVSVYVPYDGWVDIASVEKQFVASRSRDSAYAIMCDMTSVDVFLEKECRDPKARILCKIDVEGAEERVLRGMSDSLKTRNISFMIELLDEESFYKLKNILPEQYAVYPITVNGLSKKESAVYDSCVKNYYCRSRR